MGPWDGLGWGTGIALPATHPVPTPVHPSPYPGYTSRYCPAPSAAVPGSSRWLNKAVGLKSVDQLSLSVRISGSGGMTEVYNLSEIGRINNHKGIPGNE